MVPTNQWKGDEMLLALSALANPHRMRIVAALARGTNYVSQLARDLGISRPLLHMHLTRLETAGLVESHMEISEDGKAMRYFVVSDFLITLDGAAIGRAVETLSETATSTSSQKKGKPDGSGS